MIGDCPRCRRKNVQLTKDHIIPKWIYVSAHQLVPKFKKNLGKKNIEYICSPCNSKRSGKIYVGHETGLQFWLDVREEINKKINETLDTRK